MWMMNPDEGRISPSAFLMKFDLDNYPNRVRFSLWQNFELNDEMKLEFLFQMDGNFPLEIFLCKCDEF